MLVDAGEIEDRIRQELPDADVRAVDLRGTGDHFEVTVVSAAFEGASLVAQHRMVYAALGDAMREAIHALALNTMTPEQFREGLVTKIGKAD